MRLAIVQGTRPEIIKNYSIVKALRASGTEFEVLHTGQHYDRSMARDIYEEMGYWPSRMFTKGHRIGLVIDWLQKTYKRDCITHVLVNGDTAASVAGALAAMYSDIPVSHVEAGLRSRDPYMPEERNRIMVDAIASSLFAYTTHELQVLRECADIRGKLYAEGNTTVDLLHDFAHKISEPPISGPYIFVTAHRKEFTESQERMRTVFSVLQSLVADICPVIFPIHPRTLKALRQFGFDRDVLDTVDVVDPLRPFESLSAIKHAAAVVTDSGCIQEEAYILNVPCVTIRDNTERHLTIKHGANRISGFAPSAIMRDVRWATELKDRNWPHIYGPHGAGERIVDRITNAVPNTAPILAT